MRRTAGRWYQRYANDWSLAGFVNELPAEFFKVPVLWVHGHTHQSFDYQVGYCRAVCTPRGCAAWTSQVANREFDAGFVVEIQVPQRPIFFTRKLVKNISIPVYLNH